MPDDRAAREASEALLELARAARLRAGRFELSVPAGSVHRAARLRLEETPAGAFGPNHDHRASFRLSASGASARTGQPVYKLGGAAELRFSYDDLRPSGLPDAALQLLVWGKRDGAWVEVPARWDRTTRTATASLWYEGDYAVVANAAHAGIAPTTALVGSAGGMVRHGRLTLDVPPGCFAEDVRLTVGPPHPSVAPWRGGLPFPFDVSAVRVRDGQAVHRLDAALTMTVSFHVSEVGRRASVLHLAYLNEQSGRWERLPSRVDAAGGTVSAETTHLSTYLTGGSWTIDEPLDFGATWPQSDRFTGDAGFALPFELPIGPGGLQPNLRLTYSSQRSHWAQRASRLSYVNGGDGEQSSSWVGEGFEIPIGMVTMTTDTHGAHYFSMSVWGRSFEVAHDGTRWRARDDHFWKIDRDGVDPTIPDPNPGGLRYAWRAIAPDGTKYFFGTDYANYTDRGEYWDGGQVPQRWALSRIQDPSGNVVAVYWGRYNKAVGYAGEFMTATLYPKQVRYGSHDPTTAPFIVYFNRSAVNGGDDATDRSDFNNIWTSKEGVQSPSTASTSTRST